MFHHGCYLNRLLETCACGHSVLGRVFLPGSKHVDKVASLTSGMWVEDASQKRCHANSTFPSLLILEHSPRFESMTSRNQGNEGIQINSVTFTLCDDQSVSCLSHQHGAASSPSFVALRNIVANFPSFRQYCRSLGCQCFFLCV